MTFWDDLDREMLPLPLDSDTADRLLAGRIAPEDAPPGYGPVVRLFEAASADPTAEELERARVSAVVAAVRSLEPADFASPRRRFSIPIALSFRRLVAAGVVAALFTTAGLASAGSLPGAAQDIASDLLSRIGVFVPGSDDDVRPRSRTRGDSGGAASARAGARSGNSELASSTELSGVEAGGVTQAQRQGAAGPGGFADDVAGSSRSDRVKAGKGGEDSARATSSEPTGRGQGAAVSKAASGGKSKAGKSKTDKGSVGNGKAGKGSAERPGSPSRGNTANPPGKSHDKGAGKGKGSGGAGKAASGRARRP